MMVMREQVGGAQFAEALRFLDSLVDLERLRHHPGPQPYRLGRMRFLLERLGLPRGGQRFAQVVGTKGKGSTCAMMESVLSAAGYKVGMFSSPHLFSPRERIRIAGQPVDENTFAASAAEVAKHTEEAGKIGDGRATYFEAVTAMAIWCWAETGVEIGLLEAGLGGRLDTTTAIESVASVITHIGLEHTDILGNTLAAIAGEKAAVIRERGLAVSSSQEDEARKVITAEALKKGALLFMGGVDFGADSIACTVQGTTFDYQGIFDDLAGVRVPLLGTHQAENGATALAACECLRDFCGIRIEARAMREGLAKVEWLARTQVVQEEPPVIMDCAHSPDSARALRNVLQTVFPGRKAVLVLGVLADKDLPRIVEELAPVVARVIATQSAHPRALSAEEVAGACRAAGLTAEVRRSPAEALAEAMNVVGEDQVVCVTGSLSVAGEALAAWQAQEGVKT